MRIVIAPDSFKECLTAPEVAEALAKGVLKVYPKAEIQKIPVADGGEGTVEALVAATNGKKINTSVNDPLRRKIDSFYGLLGDGETAVIEMAAASGLDLLEEEEKNPWITSTYGTGELILHALDQNCKTIIIGIGGSATNDGGAGMAQALGAELLNDDGEQIGWGGGALESLDKINIDKMDPRIQDVKILVASDVTNPLTGPDGASNVYGPQKGANEEMVGALDENLKHYAHLIRRDLGKLIDQVAGAGAAGGMGAGLMSFLNAELRPGFDLVKDLVRLEEKIRYADLVITGEGKIDHQTQFGKTPFGVAQVAKKFRIPVIGMAGTVGDRSEELFDKGIDTIFSILDKPMTLQEALGQAALLLEKQAERVMRLHKISSRKS